LIFQYGTDPGMFNNTMDYLSKPKPGSDGTETYVQEFADYARRVVEGGYGTYALVGTDFGWHVILCTMSIEPGEMNRLNKADYDNIVKYLADNDVYFDEITGDMTYSVTYKLLKVMRDEITSNVYNEESNSIIKNAESKVTKYESRYKDLWS
jgi:hypothetical protein